MVRRWTKHLGQEEAIRLMMWNNSDPSFSLRFLVSFLSIFLLGTWISWLPFSGANDRANSGKGVSRADLVTKLDVLKVIDYPFQFLVWWCWRFLKMDHPSSLSLSVSLNTQNNTHEHIRYFCLSYFIGLASILRYACQFSFLELQVPHELSFYLNDFVRMKTGLQVWVKFAVCFSG